jgi:hypothetical protein
MFLLQYYEQHQMQLKWANNDDFAKLLKTIFAIQKNSKRLSYIHIAKKTKKPQIHAK